jgi:hypothetical protein
MQEEWFARFTEKIRKFAGKDVSGTCGREIFLYNYFIAT